MVRNIIAQLYYGVFDDFAQDYLFLPYGALSSLPNSDTYSPHLSSSQSSWQQGANTLQFEANDNTASSYQFNPISGHANGSDIHPYSIRLLPILIY